MLNDLDLQADETPGMDYHRKMQQFAILKNLTAWQYRVRLSRSGNSFPLFRFSSGDDGNVNNLKCVVCYARRITQIEK